MSNPDGNTITWLPSNILKSGNYALCVLNQPVVNPSTLIKLWNNAGYRVTVDGGTSIWAAIVNNTEEQISVENPDLITGDFDSADQAHVQHFRALGTKVVETPDQDQTDFTKCLEQLGLLAKSDSKLDKVEAVVAFVETSGRLDQVMANLQTLFLAEKLVPWPVYLVSSCSMSWLLGEGNHKIDCGGLVSSSSAHCGLIPLDGQAVVTTSGLKWNLSRDKLRFGDLVSTSNGFDTSKSEVMVTTNMSLLWTMDWGDRV